MDRRENTGSVNRFSNKLGQFLPSIIGSAEKSPIAHQHVAGLFYGGVLVAQGFNTLNGIKPHHAEYAVVRRFLIDRGFRGWVHQQGFLWRGERPPCIKCSEEY